MLNCDPVNFNVGNERCTSKNILSLFAAPPPPPPPKDSDEDDEDRRGLMLLEDTNASLLLWRGVVNNMDPCVFVGSVAGLNLVGEEERMGVVVVVVLVLSCVVVVVVVGVVVDVVVVCCPCVFSIVEPLFAQRHTHDLRG